MAECVLLEPAPMREKRTSRPQTRPMLRYKMFYGQRLAETGSEKTMNIA
jgi:hypothetical protein